MYLSHLQHVSNSYIANKRGCVQIIPPSWGLSYQFDWHAIKFETVVENDLRVNQNDMTRPNSVVLFAQTRVFRYVTVLYHPILHIDYLTLFLASIYRIK